MAEKTPTSANVLVGKLFCTLDDQKKVKALGTIVGHVSGETYLVQAMDGIMFEDQEMYLVDLKNMRSWIFHEDGESLGYWMAERAPRRR